MNPVLKSLDVLHVAECDIRKIRCGDVIAFIPPGAMQKIAHRAVSVKREVITARGDNNLYVDPWPLTSENILGRVIYTKRGTRLLPVQGGLKGQLIAITVKSLRFIDRWISAFLSPCYHYLARTGAFHRLFSNLFRVRILSLNRQTGTESQLLIGHRVIGRRLPGSPQWNIRRPFRIFLNKTFSSGIDTDFITDSKRSFNTKERAK